MTGEEYWYWLCNIKDMWQGKIDKLVRVLESPKKIFEAKGERLLKIKGLKPKDITNIMESKKNLSNLTGLDQLYKKEIKFIYYGHKDYPEKLRHLYDKPYCLYIKGSLPDPRRPAVAIVGARNCTKYGKEMAIKLAGELAGYKIQVISGLARGIDSYGQWGAVKNGGRSFGVLGCGIDICYPAENIELYYLTEQNGGLISEYPLGAKPLAWHFPHRNRLISGFSDKVVVVEAREKSGSLITVECALEQGKDVFAVPGRLTDPLSEGCNRLIKEGAQVFTDPGDLFDNLQLSEEKFDKIHKKPDYTLEKEFEVVYSCLDLLPKNLQEIIEETGLSGRDVIGILVELEIIGLIDEPAKNFYSRKG